MSVTSTTAAAMAFLIGRYAAREAVQRWAARSPKFAAIDRAIGEGGWKIIALLRLSPAVPFSLSNYLYGLTSIRLWPYVITSWLAMLPGTFMYVYLGYAGRAGLTAVTSNSSGRSPGQWAMLVIGLAATVAVTVYVTSLARKAIKEHAVDDDANGLSNAKQLIANPARNGKSWIGAVIMAMVAFIMTGITACAYANKSAISGLFGPPPVSSSEKFAETSDGPSFDHSTFDALLREYVDDAGFVDYKGLAADAGELDRYIASLAKAPIDSMGRNQRLALLINAYNAFTLRLILDHYPVKSIKDIPGDKRWDDQWWNIGGKVLSLNQIEHEQIRPDFKEPRVHFALVCAAVGCPPLRHEAYTADRLEDQLEAQAVYVHTHDRWFQFDTQHNKLMLTSLYNRYGGDFEQVAGSVAQYASRYSVALQAALKAGKSPKVEYLDYDWSLNSKENAR